MPVKLYAGFNTYEVAPEASEISFKVDATWHTVKGTAHNVDGTVEFNPEKGDVRIPFMVRIAVRSIDTGIPLRNRQLYDLFEADRFPYITWEAKEMTCEPLEEKGPAACQAQGELTIRSVKKPLRLPVLLEQKNQSILALDHFIIRLNEFGIESPSLLGFFQISNEVLISFKILWKEKQAARKSRHGEKEGSKS